MIQATVTNGRRTLKIVDNVAYGRTGDKHAFFLADSHRAGMKGYVTFDGAMKAAMRLVPDAK